MTTYSWIAGTSGVWTTAANWSSDVVPGAGDTAVIAAPGSYVVSIPGSVTVGGLILDDSGADVSINGDLSVTGSLTVTSGLLTVGGSLVTSSLTNTGTIDDNGTIALINLDNAGTIFLAGNLNISGADFTNTGTIVPLDEFSTVTVSGSVLSAPLQRIGGADGKGYIIVDGTVNNAGATLGGPGPSFAYAGLVQGGTIYAPEIDPSSVSLNNGTTLDAVTLDGQVAANGTITILDGLSGPSGGAPAVLTSTSGGTLDFANTETLGNLVANFSGVLIAADTLTTDSTTVLQIGPGDILGSLSSVEGAGTFVNGGTTVVNSYTGHFGEGEAQLEIDNANVQNTGVLAAIDLSGSPGVPGDDVGVDVLSIDAPILVNQAGGIIETGREHGGSSITIGSTTDFINDGTLLTRSPASTNGGIINILTTVQGNGTIGISGGGQVRLDAATSSTQIIDFIGAGTLTLDDPNLVPAAIEGLGTADTIILPGYTATALSYTDGDLKLQTASGTLDLGVTGDYTLSDFLVQSIDASTDITVLPPDNYVWTAGTSGLWTTAANWSGDLVPGAGDTALVILPGNYVISVPGTVTVANLTLDDAGGGIDVGGGIAVTGSLTVDAGSLDVSGSLSVAGGMTITAGMLTNSGNFAAPTLTNAGTIDNSGTLVTGILGNTGSIDNTGTLVLTGSELSNSGTITNTAGEVLVTGAFNSSPLAESGGTIVVSHDGDLSNVDVVLGAGNAPSLIDYGTVHDGTLATATIYAGATLGDIVVSGIVQVLGDTTVLNGVSGPIGGAPGTLDATNMPSGEGFTFADTETIDNLVLVGSGTIDTGSVLAIDSNVRMIVDGAPDQALTFVGSGTVANAGAVVIGSTGGLVPGGTTVIAIQNADFLNSGLLAATDISQQLNVGIGEREGFADLDITAATFVNQAGGLIETGQSFGVGFVTIAASTNFTNDGTLSTWDTATGAGGTIDIAALVQGNGTIDINGGGQVTLEAATSNAQIIDFLGAGTLTLDQSNIVPATIEGLDTAGTIVLAGVSATAVSYISGDLKLQTSSGTLDLAVTGAYTLSDFLVTTAGGNTDITVLPSQTFTWISGTSGLWTTATDWSAGVVPGVGDIALVGVPGAYTVSVPGSVAVASLIVNNAQAEIDVAGTFLASHNLDNNFGTIDNSGTLLATGFNSTGAVDNTGTLILTGTASNSGTIFNTGGTVIGAGPSILSTGLIQGGTVDGITLLAGSTIDGVTVSGGLAAIGDVTILDGLTGAGAPMFTFSGASLDFTGSQTLDPIALSGLGTIVTDSTLTIASGVTISQAISAQVGTAGALAFDGTGTIINQGSILATSVNTAIVRDTLPPFTVSTIVGNASLTIQTADFENFGVIDAADASGQGQPSDVIAPGIAALDIDSSAFVNQTGGVIETGQSLGVGFITIAASTTFSNDGTMSTNDQSTASPGGGTIDIGASVAGSGAIVIDGGTVIAEVAVGGGQTITFVGAGDLILDQPTLVPASIQGFNKNDQIVLNGVSATPISFTSGDLKLQTATGTIDLGVTGTFAVSDFVVSVQSDDTTITVPSLPCLAAGSRVTTDRGTVVVEQLRVGDTITTATGEQEAIQWIGHRDVDCRRHPDPESVWPIRIAAHAFGHNQPRRALLLSPDHAVFADGCLVPIKHLVNGTSIVQRKVVRITYYHVELPRHDLLLAENLPIESYLETGGRPAFANGGEVMQLHPNFAPDPVRAALIWDSEGYAPLTVAPAQLAPIRERLERQAIAPRAARKARRNASTAA